MGRCKLEMSYSNVFTGSPSTPQCIRLKSQMVRLSSILTVVADSYSSARRNNLGSILDGLRSRPSGTKSRHDNHHAFHRTWWYSRNCRTCSIRGWLLLVHHGRPRHGRLRCGRRVSCCVHCCKSILRQNVSQLTWQSIEGAEASFKRHRGFFFMMTTTGCLITGQLLTLIVCLSKSTTSEPREVYSYNQSSLERPSTTIPLYRPS